MEIRSIKVDFDFSTHSLTKRLTDSYVADHRSIRLFNSQPHEEADEIVLLDCGCDYFSTHSLTKRLTKKLFLCAMTITFQLTASRRG